MEVLVPPISIKQVPESAIKRLSGKAVLEVEVELNSAVSLKRILSGGQ